MKPLEKTLRRKLEDAVKAAREKTETAARAGLERLGVGSTEAPRYLDAREKELRKALRAHGRQLGDQPGKGDTQGIDRLVTETAYEHWHRMLFSSRRTTS
jgi:hypothetical protein